MDVEEFNRAQTAKWLHLPHATVSSMVDELGKRDGVYVKKMSKGDSFNYVATGRCKLVIVEKGV